MFSIHEDVEEHSEAGRAHDGEDNKEHKIDVPQGAVPQGQGHEKPSDVVAVTRQGQGTVNDPEPELEAEAGEEQGEEADVLQLLGPVAELAGQRAAPEGRPSQRVPGAPHQARDARVAHAEAQRHGDVRVDGLEGLVADGAVDQVAGRASDEEDEGQPDVAPELALAPDEVRQRRRRPLQVEADADPVAVEVAVRDAVRAYAGRRCAGHVLLDDVVDAADWVDG